MSNPINFYASKIFAEHPLALWSLDDRADYISLISEADQDLSDWTVSNAVVENAVLLSDNPSTAPFPNAFVNAITEVEPVVAPEVYTSRFETTFEITPSDINAELGSFSMGVYVYPYPTTFVAPELGEDEKRLVSIRLGYETESDVKIKETTLKLYADEALNIVDSTRQWTFVSQTFQLPENFETLKFIVEVAYPYNPETEYLVALNGISAGQWSEEFQAVSLGVTPETIVEAPIEDLIGVETLSYGLQNLSAYYIVDNNVLCAKNVGLPLVYGTNNSTLITKNENGPSLLFPGLGFLNQAGQYKIFTAEFWAQIQSHSSEPRRIFGPLSSTDGLYVDGPFLKLKIGSSVGSHFVGEWDRPMLINIRYSPTSSSLTINGDQVFSVNYSADNITFPAKTSEVGTDQDWLGFYAYEDIPQINLESFAIYPYDVPAILNKRRMVYGQAVDFPSDLKGIGPTTSTFIDYTFANYTKNFNYPKVGQWKNGAANNMVTENKYLGPPEYDLPEINFTNKTSDQWISDLSLAQDPDTKPFLSLKPSLAWEETSGHLYFRNLNFLREETRAFFGVFESNGETQRQVLFQLFNSIKLSSITAYLENENIDYVYSYKDRSGKEISKTLYSTSGHSPGDIFMAGIDIQKFISSFGKEVSSFFNRKHGIQVYIAGTREMTGTFYGKIYKVSFSNAKNLKKIDGLFLNIGLPVNYFNDYAFYESAEIYDAGSEYFENDDAYWSFVLDSGDPEDWDYPKPQDHIASYSLLPNSDLGAFSLDIGTDSYWEDYVPLSYFGGFVKDFDQKDYFSVDMIQLNIDYPATSSLNYATFEIDEYNPTIVKKYSHGFKVGDRILFSSYKTLPEEISLNKLYYVDNVLGNNAFTFSETVGEDSLSISTNTEGPHDAILVDSEVTILEQDETSYALAIQENHGLRVNAKVSFSSTGSLPIGISDSEDYYVYRIINSSSFLLGRLEFLEINAKRTQVLVPVVIDDTQSGTHFMKTNKTKNTLRYDTRDSLVKTYISFQYLKTGSNAPEESFVNVLPLSKTNTVIPGSEWLNTKYEVLNDTVIYAPGGVDANSIAVVIHVNATIPGIISNPVKIRSLQFASKSMGNSPNAIQTRFGSPIFPYRRVGPYFDYKAKNPLTISKTTSPYLYNTGTSGIRLRGNYFSSPVLGMSFPINRNIDGFYKVGSIQMALRYDEEFFPEAPAQIFEIQTKRELLKFYLVADNENKKRGQIYAIDANTGLLKSGIMFFIDGKPVARPVLGIRNWFMLGLSFTPILDFGLTQGAIRITSPIMVNSIVHHQIQPEEESEFLALRKWNAVADPVKDWGYWSTGVADDPEALPSPDFTWQNLLILGKVSPKFIDGSDIYKEFVGTGQIIINSGKDLVLDQYQYKFYQNIRWLSQSIKPT
jgi:hypothetical protein